MFTMFFSLDNNNITFYKADMVQVIGFALLTFMLLFFFLHVDVLVANLVQTGSRAFRVFPRNFGVTQLAILMLVMLMCWESGSVWQSDIPRSEVWESSRKAAVTDVCAFPLLSAGTAERVSAWAEIRAGHSASAALPGRPRGSFTWERWMNGTGQGLQAARWWMGQTREKMGGEGGEGWVTSCS